MTAKILRYYQKEACRSVVSAWEAGEIPCVSMITGTGKALCAAAMAQWGLIRGMRILCLVPTFELVNQNYDEFVNFVSKPDRVGVVCNQLGKVQLHKQIVIAMYQSFAGKRNVCGKFDMLIVDEAGLVGNNPNSQYRKIIKSLTAINPDLKICGWTATPYRMGQGLLTQDDRYGKALFTSICYDTGVYPGIPRLIEENYLARIEIANTHDVSIDLNGVKMSGMEFNQNDVGVKFDKICRAAVEDMRTGFTQNNIKTALIFVSNINNAHHVLECWGDHETMRLVSSKSSVHERKTNIEWFKNGEGSRYLVNVGLLTTGFNMPHLQSIVLMRATTSPGLLIQMLGRLIRPYGDMIGMVWDYGSNLARLGGIDDIKIPKNKLETQESLKKTCFECGHSNILSAAYCKQCDAKFVVSEDGHYTMRTQADILREKEENKKTEHDVDNVVYSLVQRRDYEYAVERFFGLGLEFVFKDQLRLNGSGFVKEHGERALLDMMIDKADFYRLGKAGRSSENVAKLLNTYPQFFKKPVKIVTKNNGQYVNIVGIEYENE